MVSMGRPVCVWGGPFGPLCRLFNIGPKLGPPPGLGCFQAVIQARLALSLHEQSYTILMGVVGESLCRHDMGRNVHVLDQPQ